MEKMGLRGLPLSDVILDDVRIPAENVMGGAEVSFNELKRLMTFGKLCLAAQCLGIMQASLEESVKYANTRMHFDKPIIKLRPIRWLLAEMASRLEASRRLTYHAAYVKEQDGDVDEMIRDVAICKLFVTQTAVDVARMGVEIHGSYGLIKDYKMERLFRDAKMYELLEGSAEIQRELIAPRVARQYA